MRCSTWFITSAICVTALITGASQGAQAQTPNGPTFDCTKAKLRVEQLICENPQLARLDVEMLQTYRQAAAVSLDANALKASQLAWLRSRNACTDVTCLFGAFSGRMAQLNEQAGISTARVEPPPAARIEPVDNSAARARAAEDAAVRAEQEAQRRIAAANQTMAEAERKGQDTRAPEPKAQEIIARSREACLEARSDPNKCINLADAALKIKPNDATLLAYLANGLLSQSAFEEALIASDQSIKIEPKNGFALRVRGAILRNLDRFDEAIEDLTAAIELNERHPNVYLNRSMSYLSKKELTKALQDADIAIALKSKNASIYIYRAKILVSLLDFKRAVVDYDAALSLNPNDWFIINKDKNQALEKIAENEQLVAAAAKKAAAAEAENKRLMAEAADKAVAVEYQKLEAARWEEQRKIDIRNAENACVQEVVNPDDTILACTAASRGSQNARVYASLSNAYAAKQRFEEALENANRAILIDPKLGLAYRYRGGIYLNQKNYDQALIDLNKALNLGERNPNIYVNRAVIFGIQKMYDESIADCNEALKIDPKSFGAYRTRGTSRFYKGEYEKSIMDFDEALRLNPGDEQTIINKKNSTDVVEENKKISAQIVDSAKIADEISKNKKEGYGFVSLSVKKEIMCYIQGREGSGLLSSVGLSTAIDSREKVLRTIDLRQFSGIFVQPTSLKRVVSTEDAYALSNGGICGLVFGSVSELRSLLEKAEAAKTKVIVSNVWVTPNDFDARVKKQIADEKAAREAEVKAQEELAAQKKRKRENVDKMTVKSISPRTYRSQSSSAEGNLLSCAETETADTARNFYRIALDVEILLRKKHIVANDLFNSNENIYCLINYMPPVLGPRVMTFNIFPDKDDMSAYWDRPSRGPLNQERLNYLMFGTMTPKQWEGYITILGAINNNDVQMCGTPSGEIIDSYCGDPKYHVNGKYPR